MAKSDDNAVQEVPVNVALVKLLGEISTLAHRIDVVRCTALCVKFALRCQNAEQDYDIAKCVDWNIADKLYQLVEEIEVLVVAHGGEAVLTGPPGDEEEYDSSALRSDKVVREDD